MSWGLRFQVQQPCPGQPLCMHVWQGVSAKPSFKIDKRYKPQKLFWAEQAGDWEHTKCYLQRRTALAAGKTALCRCSYLGIVMQICARNMHQRQHLLQEKRLPVCSTMFVYKSDMRMRRHVFFKCRTDSMPL
jgi:hypothetical protein